MRAALYSPDGAERVTGEATFAADDRAAPARLAADLLARAVPAITVHFSGANA
jgi:hydroxymethylbilane synthase